MPTLETGMLWPLVVGLDRLLQVYVVLTSVFVVRNCITLRS